MKDKKRPATFEECQKLPCADCVNAELKNTVIDKNGKWACFEMIKLSMKVNKNGV